MHTLRLLNARAGVYTVNYDNSNNGKYRNKEQSGSERAGDRAGWGESWWSSGEGRGLTAGRYWREWERNKEESRRGFVVAEDEERMRTYAPESGEGGRWKRARKF